MDCLSKSGTEEKVVVGGMEVVEDITFGGVVDGKMCCLWSSVSFLSFTDCRRNPETFRISWLELSEGVVETRGSI